jgi:hypothetical protein
VVSEADQQLLNRWQALASGHDGVVTGALAPPPVPTGTAAPAPVEDSIVATAALTSLAGYAEEYERVSAQASGIAARIRAGTAAPGEVEQLRAALTGLGARRSELARTVAPDQARDRTVRRMRSALTNPDEAAAAYPGAPQYQGGGALFALVSLDSQVGLPQVGQHLDLGATVLVSPTYTVQPPSGRARVVIVPSGTTSARNVGDTAFLGETDVAMFGPGTRFTVTDVVPADPTAGRPAVVVVAESAPDPAASGS